MIKKTLILSLLSAILICMFIPLSGPEITVFGPKQYLRSTGEPFTETDTFTSIITGSDFTMRVINGNWDGTKRVEDGISSATVYLNGELILGPSDFNKNIGLIERTVTINTTNELAVTLSSSPDSYISLSILGSAAQPTVMLTATPQTINFGESSTLSWTSTDADTATIDNGIGNVPSSGSYIVTPEIPSTTYTITVTGPGGTASANTTVNVTFPQPTAELTASPTNILLGESSTLTWSTSNANTVSIDQGIGTVDLNGSSTVTPSQTTTYTLTATGYGGTVTSSTTVNVQVDQTSPTITISSPADGSQHTLLPIAISASYQDDSSGINQSSVKVELNGNDITSGLTVTASSVTGEISNETFLQSGTNTLVVEVADNAGNIGSESSQFEYQEIQQEDMTIIYGRVFEAGTESPLSDAVITSSGNTSQSDADGYWSLVFGTGGTYKIKITKDGYTEVFRKIYLETGKEGVVDNAYLTLRDTKTTAIGPDGGTHSNSDGTVEVIIPQGAVNDIKDIQATRLSSSKALPGDLNETDNLKYPISFIFCADFGPDETIFNTPVTIRVQNSWGFAAGTEIPYAEWDKGNQKWVAQTGMAIVDSSGNWLEAEVTHFSTYDINGPIVSGGNYADIYFEPEPDCPVCDFGSSVNSHSGILTTEFSIPGLKLRGGDTGLSFVYNSSTAYPWKAIRMIYYINPQLVDIPSKAKFSTSSALVSTSGVSSGNIAALSYSFNPTSSYYGMGSIFLSGKYPSGRWFKTGYHNFNFSFTHFYEGEYATTNSWGGMPILSTGVTAQEPAYYKETSTKRIFMLSRRESVYGKGWGIQGLNRLHFEGNRIVVENGSGKILEYEKGINYADISMGAVFNSSNGQMLNTNSMLTPKISQSSGHKLETRFYIDSPASEFDQTFVIDLGQEREIYEIGLDFQRYWRAFHVWDYIKISTSLDNQNWDLWDQHGEPTLHNPSDGMDGLDIRMQSPQIFTRINRTVRYIKFQLGYPAVNSAHPGSMINRVFAIGNEYQYRNVNENPWPKLEYNSSFNEYTIIEFSGEQTVFDSDGLMIKKIDRQGRTISYQYSGDKLSHIQYPEGPYMDFVYNASGFISKVVDSSGRETNITTDSNGNILEVFYPDNTSRTFEYNERNLMTIDQNGDAIKTYTWDEDKPILKKVTLPNNGERFLEPAILKYLLNDIQSTPDNPVNFPMLSNESGLDSEAIYEDGKTVQYRNGRGWSSRTENSQLKEKTTYADQKYNRLPIKIEKGIDQYETTDIYYNDELQLKKVETSLTDTKWGKVDSDPNAHYEPKTDNLTAKTYTMEVSYNANNLVSNVKAYGIDNTYTYDTNNNLIQIYDEIRLKTATYTYDTNNNLIRIDSPDGLKDEMTYNDKGLIMEVINNDGTKTVVTRNIRGEITSITDEENRTVTIDRDIMGRVIKETSPGGRIVEYQWGGTGCTSCGSDLKLTKIIDSGSKTWEFNYNIMGNPIEMIYPDGTKIIQTYDIASRLSTTTNKRGQVIEYGYDGDGRLSEKTTPEGVIYFSYDDRNRITDIEATDYHYQYEYGLADTYVLEHLPIVKETNLLTNRWSEYISTYEGFPFEYFDSFWWRKVYEYKFNSSDGTPPGPTPSRVTYYRKAAADNYTTWYEYDNGYRVLKKTQSYLGRDVTFSYKRRMLLRKRYYEYQYSGYPFIETFHNRDSSGIITSITGDKALTTFYNPDLEIEQVQHTVPQTFDENYTYDTRGNRLTSLTNSYTYNDLNQLTASNTHSYTYDADGNMTEEKNIATTETRKFYYNSENRMIKYEHFPTEVEPADIIAEYTYDIYGRRIQKNVNGNITNFHWEGDNMSFELNSSNQPIRRYIYENGKDDVQAHVEYAEVDDPQYFSFERKGWYSYIKDQVGTITKVYKHETKQMINTKTYDTFGNLVNQTGSSNGNLGFQSKYFDQESGLNYYYHRYYSPSLGRFINEDPIGLSGGMNMLNFVNNNPINFLDPFGLQFDPEEEEENIKGTPIPRPRSKAEIMYNNILIKKMINLSKDSTNPRLLCCLATCAGPEVTKIVVKEIMIHIIVDYIFNVGPITPIVTLPITLHAGEKIMEKIMKCYIFDCAHLR